jgi:putative glutamine amidotransferase
MSKPIVLLPTPVQDPEMRRFAMGKNYVRSLIECGAVPVMLPTGLDMQSVREMYAQADGVLLSGGSDIDPVLFGEERHPETDGIDAERDGVEMAITQWAMQDDKPAFFICRGIQVQNVALGGSLIQDIPTQWPAASRLEHRGHKIGAARDEVLHEVCVEPNCKLASIIGAGNIGTNSFHHQALGRLGHGLVITSRAPDGIIESVEAPGRRWFVGVQWHPEEMTAGRPDMMALFQSFTDACSDKGV